MFGEMKIFRCYYCIIGEALIYRNVCVFALMIDSFGQYHIAMDDITELKLFLCVISIYYLYYMLCSGLLQYNPKLYSDSFTVKLSENNFHCRRTIFGGWIK